MSGPPPRPSPEFCIECYTYGVVSSGAVLIIGPPGSGKTSLAKGFIRLALQNGQPLLVLSTQTSAADLQVAAERMRQKFGGTANVIDCYAQSTENSGQAGSGMLDLVEIGKLIRRNLNGQVRPFIIFDSLDGVVLNAGEGGALQFLAKCLHDLEGSRATGIATATTGIHSSKFENMVRTYFRGVLELKIEEKEGRLQRHIRIHSLKGTSHHTEWYEFSTTEGGIVLGSDSYRSNLPPRHSELHFLRFAGDYKEPPDSEEQRKLAGIMFTDLVGFTSLAQEDEKSALRALEDHKKLLRPVFKAYNGREIKTIGDAFLVEFESALDATRCAISIQGKLRAYNARHGSAKRINVRIGVHVGDIIHKGNDIYGDAVNIASRVAPLAAPAGICITQQVFDQVHNKVKNRIVKLGPTTLKNVKSKVPVYTVAL